MTTTTVSGAALSRYDAMNRQMSENVAVMIHREHSTARKLCLRAGMSQATFSRKMRPWWPTDADVVGLAAWRAGRAA